MKPMLAVAMVVAVLGAGCSRGRKDAGACVDIGGAACQTCRKGAKIPFCDANVTAPVASGKISVNGQKGCCGFNDPAMREACNNITRCIIKTGCGQGNSPVPCLCGDLDMFTCARSRSWPGPCAKVYEAALARGPPGTVINVFGDPKSPVGVANNTFTCDVDASCPCGHKKKDDAPKDPPKAN